MPVVLVEALERARSQLLPDELVDGGGQQARVVGELLGGIRAAARVDDREQIVLAQIFVDELLGRALDQRAPQRRGVVVVEHHHIEAPFEPSRVRLDVRPDRHRIDDEALTTVDRNVHLREDVDLLRLPVLGDLEVLARQPLDDVALFVSDDGVDFDVVDLDAERDGRLARALRIRRRGLSRGT